MATLTANVALRHPVSGGVEVLLAGTELPAWAKEQVTNADVLDAEPPPRKK